MVAVFVLAISLAPPSALFLYKHTHLIKPKREIGAEEKYTLLK